MNIINRTDDAPESENAVRADVQNIWRKRGWRTPTEYRRDFAQSCRPAIFAGMVKLEMAKVL